jgi:outer membrane biosynthesis protein TonB
MVHNRVKPPLFTELNSSNLKKRIIMMKSKSENRFAGMARLALIPVLAVLLASLSGKETVVVNDNLDKNDKVAHVTIRSNVNEKNSQDELKSREEILHYVSKNIQYPAEARKSGHIGTGRVICPGKPERRH